MEVTEEMETLPRFKIRPLSEEEGGGHLIEFPDFPGCVSDGDMPETAIREDKDALASYIATLAELSLKSGEEKR